MLAISCSKMLFRSTSMWKCRIWTKRISWVGSLLNYTPSSLLSLATSACSHSARIPVRACSVIGSALPRKILSLTKFSCFPHLSSCLTWWSSSKRFETSLHLESKTSCTTSLRSSQLSALWWLALCILWSLLQRYSPKFQLLCYIFASTWSNGRWPMAICFWQWCGPL